MLGRYCGQHSPPDIRSSGRYLWIKFVTDGELEAVGFSASYNFTAGILLSPLGFFLSACVLVCFTEANSKATNEQTWPREDGHVGDSWTLIDFLYVHRPSCISLEVFCHRLGHYSDSWGCFFPLHIRSSIRVLSSFASTAPVPSREGEQSKRIGLVEHLAVCKTWAFIICLIVLITEAAWHEVRALSDLIILHLHLTGFNNSVNILYCVWGSARKYEQNASLSAHHRHQRHFTSGDSHMSLFTYQPSLQEICSHLWAKRIIRSMYRFTSKGFVLVLLLGNQGGHQKLQWTAAVNSNEI